MHLRSDFLKPYIVWSFMNRRDRETLDTMANNSQAKY